MLDSAEHEICPANKSQITNNCKFFLAKHSWAWKFLCKLIWKCQLLLGFSYLLAEKISCSAELSMKKCFITSGPDYIANQKSPKQSAPSSPNEMITMPDKTNQIQQQYTNLQSLFQVVYFLSKLFCPLLNGVYTKRKKMGANCWD